MGKLCQNRYQYTFLKRVRLSREACVLLRVVHQYPNCLPCATPMLDLNQKASELVEFGNDIRYTT